MFGRHGWGRLAASAATATALALTVPAAAHAFTVYNVTDKDAGDPSIRYSGTTIHAEAHLPGELPSSSDFKQDIAPGENKGCNYSVDGCGDGDRAKHFELTVTVDAVHFACNVDMRAGGFVSVRVRRRLYQPSMVNRPLEYYCDSRWDDDNGHEQPIDVEPGGIGATERSVTFTITGDPQYDNGDGEGSDAWDNANTTLKAMQGFFGDPTVRGAIVSGDLTQNSRPIDEWKAYRKASDNLKPGDIPSTRSGGAGSTTYWDPYPQGLGRSFFETGGNHDGNYPSSIADTNYTACTFAAPGCNDPDGIFKEINYRDRTTVLTKRGGANYASDDHNQSPGLYSWDWNDIHFINLGPMGADEKASAANDIPAEQRCALYGTSGFTCTPTDYAGPEPGKSLSFLKDDLAENVGDSGRPVVIIQHYGLDDFSTGKQCVQDEDADKKPIANRCHFQVWWTPAQQKAEWEAMQDYNVVAMFSGHVHLGGGSAAWKQTWKKPDAALGGPASITDYVAGAALHDVFVWARISDAQTVCAHGPDQTCLQVVRLHATGGTTFEPDKGADGQPLADVHAISAPRRKWVPTVSVNASTATPVTGQAMTYSATITEDPLAPPGLAAPTGTISYSAGGTPIAGCQGLALGASCSQTIAASDSPVTIQVDYSGDADHAAASGTRVLTVARAATSTSLTLPAPPVSGQTVTLKAALAAVAPGSGTPSGRVAFYDGSTPISGCTGALLTAGKASCDTSFTAAGSPHSIQARYDGLGGGYLASDSAPADLSVGRGSARAALTVNATVSGQEATYHVTVAALALATGSPTGTATFLAGGTALADCSDVPLTGGAASCKQTYATPGTHIVSVSYSGDDEFKPTADAVSQVTSKAATTTTLTSSDNPSYSTDTVVFTAQVDVTAPGSGAPTGTVAFKDGTTTLCSAEALSATGRATCSTGALRSTGAAHPISATYGGDTAFASSAGSLSQTVKPRPTALSLASSDAASVVGQQVTYTATVSSVLDGDPTPDGTVSFTDNGVAIADCQALSVGTGAVDCDAKPSLAGSPHTIVATFAGGDTWGGSSHDLAQRVDKGATTTALSSSADPSVSGQSVLLQARVTVDAPAAAVPAGTVRFAVAGTALQDCDAVALGTDGVAGCHAAFTAAAAGRAVTATYSGDGELVGSADSLTQNTDKARTTTSLTSSANPSVSGQAVTYTATIAVTAPGAAPTAGAVSFADADGTVPDCGAVAVDTSAHTATCTTTYASPAGSPHAVVARYGGSGELEPSASPAVSQVVHRAATATALTSSDDHSVVGQAVTLTATVTVRAPGGGSPGGTVAFLDHGTAIDGCGAAAVDGAGKATCTTRFATTAGSPRTLTAAYSGDSAFEGSTSEPVSQSVAKAPTAISFTQRPNPAFFLLPMTVTIAVSPQAPGAGTPTGNVRFVTFNLLGLVTTTEVRPLVDGKASFTMLRLNNSYAVRYDGDGNYLATQTTITPR